VNRDEFEARVIDLWMTTRVPLTRANLQFATGTPRKQMERWLDALVVEGVVEVDPDDSGDLVYSVRGAARSSSGATSVADVVKLEALARQVRKPAKALVPAILKRPESLLAPAGDGQKSIVASAALSFFLGPIGWLYAAPLREALPAILGFVLLYKLLPAFLLVPLFGVLLPISAVAGAAYAWAHNQAGGRAGLGDATRRLKDRD
jgi:hypothetical protein